MFNAFKKLTGRGGGVAEGANGPAPPPGLTTMSLSLQKKFGKGVHYNMKIILKGDRNVGKTQLFRRLQGLPFVEEYTATEEITVANITWNYKTSDDIVKVEIWDIVDVANKKKRFPADKLKLQNSSAAASSSENGEAAPPPQSFALDANTIDVYKNTNGVILLFDITKQWTFDYIKREIDNVPDHIPILIMGNRRDMGHHRAVASDTVTYFIEGLERDTAEIRYAESSMRNGFGLKYIHKFFNLPYLHLQKDALLKQLEVNRQETDITIQELEYYAEGDDANYELFMDGLSQKRRQVADALSPPKLSLAEAQAVASAKALKDSKSSEAAAVAARLAIKSDPTTNRGIEGVTSVPRGLVQSASMTADQFKASSGGGGDRNGANANSELIQGNSRISGSTSSPNIAKSARQGANTNKSSQKSSGGVEDFVPEDDIHKIISFLDDGINGGGGQPMQPKNNLHFEESSDEEEGARGQQGNPMVVAIEEDVEEDTDFANITKLPTVAKVVPVTFSLSSSEDEGRKVEDSELFPGPTPSSKVRKGMGTSAPKLGFQVFVQEEKGESSGDSKEKKSSKKSHHKKSKHKKKKEHTHHTPDLEDFLSGEPGSQLQSVDTSAYEAL